MTVLALRLANVSNGVSKLHGQVSRKMWRNIWSDLPEAEVPITSITNGVHTASWVSPDLSQLYDRYLGTSWSERTENPTVWKRAESSRPCGRNGRAAGSPAAASSDSCWGRWRRRRPPRNPGGGCWRRRPRWRPRWRRPRSGTRGGVAGRSHNPGTRKSPFPVAWKLTAPLQPATKPRTS